MRIAIDARSLTTRPTGVGQYLMAAVNVWSEIDKDIEFILIAHKPIHAQAVPYLRSAPNIRYAVCRSPLLPSNGLVWMVIWFAKCAQKLGATHIWGASGILPPWGVSKFATILTVHDLVFETLPWTLSWKSRLAYGLLAKRAIHNADILWSVSQYTSNEVDRLYRNISAKERIVGSGLNPQRSLQMHTEKQIEEVAARYRINDRTLLFVGTLEPRKNLRFLLALMPELARHGFNFLVVGCSGWGRSDLSTIVKQPQFPQGAVHFCDYVPDEDLQALYHCVAFFISASLMEGFGLPHLEAMSAGCPVIAPANSAIVEVVGDGGLLIGGWSQEDWCRGVDEAFRMRPELSDAAMLSAKRHLISDACYKISCAIRNLASR
jgi:glycosyltransferase involved in cell wall biosynthesis